MDEAPKLHLSISFDLNSGLFQAYRENGEPWFNFSPANVSGKLGSNLDLLRDYTTRNSKAKPPHPHVSATKHGDDLLIEEAIKAGKLQKVGVIVKEEDLIDF